MAGESNTTTLTGLYKIVYGDLISAVGDDTKILRDLPFVGGAEGEQLQNAVITSTGDGFTGFGSKYTTSASLGLSTSEVIEKQVFNAVEWFYKGGIIINSIKYATSSPTAFAKATKTKFMSDKASIDNRTEFQTLYGQSGILDLGTQSNKTGSTGAITLDIPDAQYFVALRRFYNHLVIFRSTADGTTDATNGAVFRIRGVSGALGSYTVSLQEVNSSTGVNVTAETNADALGTAISSTAQTMYFYNSVGVAVTYEPVGIRKALNTTTGSLWNIAVANPNYGPRPLTLTGAPGASHFEHISERAIDGGFSGGTLNVYMSPKRWSLLVVNDLIAKRIYNDAVSSGKVSTGTREYAHESADGVSLRIITSPFIKNGDIFALPKGDWERTGANDWTQVVNEMGSMFLWNGGNSWSYAHQTIQAPRTDLPVRSVYAYGATLS